MMRPSLLRGAVALQVEGQPAIRRVGFVGVGHMGGAMAEAMLQAGFDVMAYDLQPAKLRPLQELGAKIARDGAAVAQHAELLSVAIAGDEHLEDALLGEGRLLDALSAGSIVAIHTTAHPQLVKRVARCAAAKGVFVIDAPVSGGRRGTETRSLCFMVGGDPEVVARCIPVFATFGTAYHVGALGNGTVTKIAQQMMTTINIVGVDEAARLVEAYGIDLRTFLAVVAATTGQSHVADSWIDRLRKIGPGMVESFYTSLDPAITLARELGVSAPATSLAQERIRDVFSAYEGDATG